MKFALFFISLAMAAPCPEQYAALEPAHFWQSSEPILVEGKPLTFSMDSEISIENAFRELVKDKKSMDQLYAPMWYTKEALEILNGVPAGALEFPKVAVKDLLTTLKVSQAQFQTFALRKGIDKTLSTYSLLDLNPAYFAQAFFHLVPQGPERITFFHHLRTTFLDLMHERGLPVNAHFDGGNIELTHKTWETSPAKYGKLVREDLHKKIKDPQTHLHIGIPSEVPESKLFAITRAAETRVILVMAKNWYKGRRALAHFRGTALVKNVEESAKERGVIRLGVNEWSEPHLTHNLEIRQWSDIEEGMDNIKFAARLASNHHRVRVIENFDVKQITDKITGNLYGALRYASMILSASKDPASKKMAKELSALARPIKKSEDMTDAWREEVSAYLNKYSVLDRLDFDAFVE